MNRVYVYGSLREGLGNHRVLGDYKSHVGNQWLPGFQLIDLGAFPGAVKASSDHGIYCEVYEVDDDTLENLDALEGHPNFYHRTAINSVMGKGWIYIIDPSFRKNCEYVPKGDWKEYYLEKIK